MVNEGSTPAIIVGAGPYGISLAAHLNAAGKSFRIFGKPMATWREHMPENMLLKSEGFASSLSSPKMNARLDDFCAEKGLPYRSSGLPIPLALFVDYADWFRRQFAPNLEEIDVIAIGKKNDTFSVTLSDNRTIATKRVIMATGITWLDKIPDILAELPSPFLSHSSQHRDARQFCGKRVVIVGGGASAIDIASLFFEANAKVKILVRQPKVIFHNPPRRRSLVSRIRNPQTVIGPGLHSKFFTSAPLLFRRLPAPKRFEIGHSFPPAAPGWFMRERIGEGFPTILGHEIRQAKIMGAEVELTIANKLTGETSLITADHVVAATGYTVNLESIPVLSPELRKNIAHYRNSPILSNNFECSINNLYFIGPIAAPSFGPLMRFVVGAEWAVPRLVRHLSKNWKQ